MSQIRSVAALLAIALLFVVVLAFFDFITPVFHSVWLLASFAWISVLLFFVIRGSDLQKAPLVGISAASMAALCIPISFTIHYIIQNEWPPGRQLHRGILASYDHLYSYRVRALQNLLLGVTDPGRGAVSDRYASLADYVMYLETGRLAKQLKPFLDNQSKYRLFEDALLTKILPFEDRATAYRFNRFFGFRLYAAGDQTGDGLPELIATTHPAQNCLASSCFNVMILSDRIDFGIQVNFLDVSVGGNAVRIAGIRSKNRRSMFFGYNTGDLDGDGIPDLMVDEHLILSTQHDPTSGNSFDIRNGIRLASDGIFIETPEKPMLVIVQEADDRIEVVLFEYHSNARALREAKKILVQNGSYRLAPDSLFPVYPVSDIDGDGADEIAVIWERGLTVMFSGDGYDPKLASKIQFPDRGLTAGLQLGANGDFDQDGINDFWLAAYGTKESGRAVLISGRRLIEQRQIASSEMLEHVSILTFHNDVSLGGKFASSISPVAGDIDGDGLPDFSIAAHYHLVVTGALYVLFGKNIQTLLADGTTDIYPLDCNVGRLRPPLATNLSPVFPHYDHIDVDRDGYDDVIITADADPEVAPEAGSIYILSGRKITDLLSSTGC